jgi:hypothetical protein
MLFLGALAVVAVATVLFVSGNEQATVVMLVGIAALVVALVV